MDEKTPPSPQGADERQPPRDSRFEGMNEPRRTPLGQFQTLEEAQLAAEIEKLKS